MDEDPETTKQIKINKNKTTARKPRNNFMGAARWIFSTVLKGDPWTIAGVGFTGVRQKAPGKIP